MIELLNEAAKPNPLDLINALRESDRYIEDIYTHGGCYKFHLFLKSIYPDATPCINSRQEHIITLIGNNFYDITGIVEEHDYKKVDKYDLKKIKKWSFFENNYLMIVCPNCDEEAIFNRDTKKFDHT